MRGQRENDSNCHSSFIPIKLWAQKSQDKNKLKHLTFQYTQTHKSLQPSWHVVIHERSFLSFSTRKTKLSSNFICFRKLCSLTLLPGHLLMVQTY